MSEPSALAVADLVAGYSAEVDILKGVSIALAPREIVTVVGPNGAGKSTLMKAIFGLIAPKAGRVMLAGEVHHRPASQRDRAARRRLRAAAGECFSQPDGCGKSGDGLGCRSEPTAQSPL